MHTQGIKINITFNNGKEKFYKFRTKLLNLLSKELKKGNSFAYKETKKPLKIEID